MRFALLLCLLMPGLSVASGPESIADAWAYISARQHSERWLVVSSKKGSDGYLECENLDDVVRCVIPVWTKMLPAGGRYLPAGGREQPYPEVRGSKYELMTPALTEKAAGIIRGFGQKPMFIYSQVQNERKELIGTQCDLRFVLPLNYKQFDALVKAYLKEVYGIMESEGYAFQIDG